VEEEKCKNTEECKYEGEERIYQTKMLKYNELAQKRPKHKKNNKYRNKTNTKCTFSK